MRDYYEDDYSDDPVLYDEEDFSFSDIPANAWSLCGNCSNYLPCGLCALDKHEVDWDDGCTYNLKKEKKK